MAGYLLEYDRNQRAEALGLDALPASWSEGFGAVLDETLRTNPAAYLSRASERAEYYEQRFIDDETGKEIVVPPKPARVLTQQEANERYGLGGRIAFDADTPEPVAQQLYRQKLEELHHQDIQRRAQTGIGTQLLGGVIGSFADPLNILSAFVPIVGEARFAAIAGRVGTTGARGVTGAVEGAVGAAMLEPLIHAGAQWEQADYSMADSLMNITVGSVLGGGLHMSVGAVADRFQARKAASAVSRALDEMQPEQRAAVVAGSAGQILDGRPVDVEPVVQAATQEMRQRAFLTPHELRIERFTGRAEEVGLSKEQIETLLPEDVRDSITGFYRAEDRLPTLDRAIEHVGKTDAPAVYVEADIANLGGLNARFGHSKTNMVYRELAAVFQEAIREAGGTGILFRHGGDEISAIVLGVPRNTVDEALARMEPKLLAVEERFGTKDIPHHKDPENLPPGTRLNYGTATIAKGRESASILNEADSAVEVNKKRGAKDVKRGEVGETGPVAFGEQAGRAERGAGETGEQVQSGVRPADPIERDRNAARDIEEWAERQTGAEVAPKVREGVQQAEEAARGVDALADLDRQMREVEGELADFGSMVTEEDVARYDAAPDEDAPTARDIARLEEENVTYDDAVLRVANCLTGRRNG